MLMVVLFAMAVVSGMGQCPKPGLVDLKRSLGPATMPVPISVADVNGDGKQDLASVVNTSQLQIAMGIGDGSFGTPTTYVIGANRSAPFWGDLNGDGKPEMLLTTGTILDVWMNNGTGGFSLANTLTHTGEVTGVADFNGDGKGDLLSTAQGGQSQTSTFTIRFGTGNGGFGSVASYFGFGPVDRTLRAFAGDINGDGKPDVAAALDNANETIRIYLNDGSGALLLPPATGITATDLRAVVDLNNDGKPEVIGTRFGSPIVIVSKHVGPNEFTSQQYASLGQFDTAKVGDFDGDGKRDLFLSVYPGFSVMIGDGLGGLTPFQVRRVSLGVTGDINNDGTTEFIQSSTVRMTNERSVITWQSTCNGGGVPPQTDYNGDGDTEFAIFRSSNGTWLARTSDSSGTSFGFLGVAGDIPAPGDFDGDGCTDYAVFRPSTGGWSVLTTVSNTLSTVVFGQLGDKPVPGDYDGDGRTDVAVFRPSNGAWYILRSSDNAFVGLTFGISTDAPVPVDFDGDRKTDIAVFRPSEGAWYMLKSTTGEFAGLSWGTNGDRAIAADYDGDGKADVAVFRPSNGGWYILRSFNSTLLAALWGQAGDLPVPGFVRTTLYASPGNYIGAYPVIWRPSVNVFYNYPTAHDFIAFSGTGDIPVSAPYIVY